MSVSALLEQIKCKTVIQIRRKTVKNWVRLVAASIVALGLSACGVSGTSGEAARTFSGQAKDYGGPAGTLEATDDFTDATLGTGSIRADGSFSLELDQDVPETSLQPIALFLACAGATISDPGANVSILGVLDVVSGEQTGYLALTDSAMTAQRGSGSLVGRLYADRDVSVRGECTSDGTGLTPDVDFNLNLKRGWNVFAAITRSDPNAAAGVAGTLTSDIPSGVQWYYVAGEDSGSSEPPSEPSVISGQAQNYTGPERTLESVRGSTTFGTGAISSNGDFFLEFDPSVPEAALESVTTFVNCSDMTDLTISDQEAMIAFAGQINVLDGSEILGYLTADIYTEGNFDSVAFLERIYADSDVVVKGECQSLSGDQSFDLDLRGGWNIITSAVGVIPDYSSYTSGVAPGVRQSFYIPAN